VPGLYLRFFCCSLDTAPAGPLLLLGPFPPVLFLPPLPPRMGIVFPRVGTVFPRAGVPVEPVLGLPPLDDEAAAVRAIMTCLIPIKRMLRASAVSVSCVQYLTIRVSSMPETRRLRRLWGDPRRDFGLFGSRTNSARNTVFCEGVGDLSYPTVDGQRNLVAASVYSRNAKPQPPRLRRPSLVVWLERTIGALVMRPPCSIR